jgi:hypothetical protein
MISPAGQEHLRELEIQLVRGAYERRDCWPNREIAKEALKTRNRTTKWRPQILDLYVVRLVSASSLPCFCLTFHHNNVVQKYAIRDHPGTHHLHIPYTGVTLSLTRDEEAVSRQLFDELTSGAHSSSLGYV